MTTCTGKEGCKGKVILDGLCCRHLVQTCSICFEKVGSMNTCSTKRLSCGHSYHFDCILNWFATSSECPVCRAPQEADPIIKFKTKVQDEIREKYRDAIHTLENQNIEMRMAQLILNAFDEPDVGPEFVFHFNNQGDN